MHFRQNQKSYSAQILALATLKSGSYKIGAGKFAVVSNFKSALHAIAFNATHRLKRLNSFGTILHDLNFL